jgi:hypothetical protein
MDMLYPANPVPAGPNTNYAAPAKSGVTPSLIGAQNALDVPKEALVPENEEVAYRRAEDADAEKGRRGKKKQGADRDCQTCKERKYQDVSNDASVSFQTPTKLNPAEAEGAVRAHEHQHVAHEQARAEREDREVVSQNVVIHYAVCPECGKVYVAGGTTTTVTRDATESEKLGAQYQAGVDPVPKGSSIDAGA